jgi:hypothetical protein
MNKFPEIIDHLDQNMSKIINYLHSTIIIYLLFGFIIESQRRYLVLFLPSLQYQFLVNNNMCLLTQLENKFSNKNEINNSFIDKKLKHYEIHLSDHHRELLIHTSVYFSFLLNYYLID